MDAKMSREMETLEMESKTSYQCWLRAHRTARLARCTPFVICLAAGNLEMATFHQFVGQDVHLLRAFARAYEIIEQYDDEDVVSAIRMQRERVLKNLEMHSSLLEEWGIDPTKETVPTPATAKYTDFLFATASGEVGGVVKMVTPFEKTKIPAYTVGAMASCMRLYASLGKELQKFLYHNENSYPYRKWIEHYASKKFEAEAVQVEELLDKLSVSLTIIETEDVAVVYDEAIELVLEFFAAQSVDQPCVVPLTSLHNPAKRLIVFCDFDETCSMLDSSAILAEIAILAAWNAEVSGADKSRSRKAGYRIPRKSSSEMERTSRVISLQYTDGFRQCIENLLIKKAEEFDYEGLCKGLKQVADCQEQANSKVVASGMLSGLKLDYLNKVGESFCLRLGCSDMFQKILKRKELNADIHILSYCWCADLIRSAFSSVPELNVHANEFYYENSFSTGEFSREMESPMHKLEAFKYILSNSSSNSKCLSVYFGGSVGDLLCLLNADIGIVIGPNPSLWELGKRFGITFLPLFPYLVRQQELVETESPLWKGYNTVHGQPDFRHKALRRCRRHQLTDGEDVVYASLSRVILDE